MNKSGQPVVAQVAMVLVPLTAAMGHYFLPLKVGPIEIFGFRILVLCCAAGLLLSTGWKWAGLSREARGLFLLGGFWVTWACFSLIWAPSMWGLSVGNALGELFAVLFGFVVCGVMLGLSAGRRSGLEALRLGWVSAFIVTSGVALWEVVTGSHLQGYATNNFDDRTLNSILFSTLGNPNNYAAFLVLCFPFLLWSYLRARGVLRILYLIFVLVLPVIVFVVQGRLAIIGLALQLLLSFTFHTKERRRVLVTGLLLAVFGSLVGLSFLLFPATSKLLTLGTEFQGEGERLNLTRNGLVFLGRSGGMGIGPGNFEQMNASGLGPYPTEGLNNPHNFWIEVGAQYGLAVLVWLIAWLIGVAVALARARKSALLRGDSQAWMASEAALSALLAYPLVAMENSSYISQSTNWVFLGSLVVIVTCVAYKPANAHEPRRRVGTLLGPETRHA